MPQSNRAKPGSKGTHLASINFPKELLEWLNALSEETGMNRSSLVCAILEDFKESGMTVKLVVQNPAPKPMAYHPLVEYKDPRYRRPSDVK